MVKVQWGEREPSMFNMLATLTCAASYIWCANSAEVAPGIVVYLFCPSESRHGCDSSDISVKSSLHEWTKLTSIFQWMSLRKHLGMPQGSHFFLLMISSVISAVESLLRVMALDFVLPVTAWISGCALRMLFSSLSTLVNSCGKSLCKWPEHRLLRNYLL